MEKAVKRGLDCADLAVTALAVRSRLRATLGREHRLQTYPRNALRAVLPALDTGNQLIVELRSTSQGEPCSIETEKTAVHPPATLVRLSDHLQPGQVVRSNRDQPGCDVAVYRLRRAATGELERTLISVDSYPTLNTVLKVPARQTADVDRP